MAWNCCRGACIACRRAPGECRFPRQSWAVPAAARPLPTCMAAWYSMSDARYAEHACVWRWRRAASVVLGWWLPHRRLRIASHANAGEIAQREGRHAGAAPVAPSLAACATQLGRHVLDPACVGGGAAANGSAPTCPAPERNRLLVWNGTIQQLVNLRLLIDRWKAERRVPGVTLALAGT